MATLTLGTGVHLGISDEMSVGESSDAALAICTIPAGLVRENGE